MSSFQVKFRINLKEGSVELEGNEQFVDKHLEKFEEIFKSSITELMTKKVGHDNREELEKPVISVQSEILNSNHENKRSNNHKHNMKYSPNIVLIPVDLKGNGNKIGLREFYNEKKPLNHYEKCILFVYYLTKFNQNVDVKYGEILSCYDEVNEKKPSIADIIKNSIRYKGWLEQGHEKFSTRITISGENFVKFDLPSNSSK